MFELFEVTKTYGSITALDGLSAEAPAGAVGLLGPNGAGKTTMIRALLGLIALDSGWGRVLGLEINNQPLDIRQRVGFVPENECLFPGVVGIEFVAYAGELAGMAARSAMQRAHEVLDYVGLGEERYRRVESYSTGMKQRIKLASAIVHDPQLLVLDEPTNGMDPKGRDEILALARDLSAEKGMSLLFSSHLLPDVEEVCEHVLVLGNGRLLASGRIAELKAAQKQAFQVRVKADRERFARLLTEAGCQVEAREESLFVQLAPGQSSKLLWEKARQADEQIRHLRPQRSTLEEVFLRAVREQSNAHL